MASVGLDDNRFFRKTGDQFQMAYQEFFFEFAVGLIDKLDKVDTGQLNL